MALQEIIYELGIYSNPLSSFPAQLTLCNSLVNKQLPRIEGKDFNHF